MKNLNSYILKLNDALQEKLFFVNKIDWYKYDIIIDFGCATGALLKAVQDRVKYTGISFVGYDANPDMISIAKQNNPNITFTDDWTLIQRFVTKASRPLVIFSSVLHEISESNDEAWNNIQWIMKACHTIVIRDMKRPLNNEPIDTKTRKRLLSRIAPWQAELFESKWGPIRNKEDMYRLFLMNEFVENFETEVEEDYFSVPWAELGWLLEDTHDVLYERSYTLPYRKQQVKRVFSHVMNDITHKEIIFIRKSKS